MVNYSNLNVPFYINQQCGKFNIFSYVITSSNVRRWDQANKYSSEGMQVEDLCETLACRNFLEHFSNTPDSGGAMKLSHKN
jgi:hypothetical protein